MPPMGSKMTAVNAQKHKGKGSSKTNSGSLGKNRHSTAVPPASLKTIRTASCRQHHGKAAAGSGETTIPETSAGVGGSTAAKCTQPYLRRHCRRFLNAPEINWNLRSARIASPTCFAEESLAGPRSVPASFVFERGLRPGPWSSAQETAILISAVLVVAIGHSCDLNQLLTCCLVALLRLASNSLYSTHAFALRDALDFAFFLFRELLGSFLGVAKA